MASPIRGIALLMALTGLLLALPAVASSLLDPQIRAVHFEARLGEPQLAMTRLQAARRQGFLDHQAQPADLLLGDMLLQQGLDLPAEAVLRRVGKAGDEQADAAWLQLGRLHYRRGEDEAALAAFTRIRGSLSRVAQQERLLLEGELLLRSGRLAEAEQRLRALLKGRKKRSDWVDYGRFNLAVVLFRSGREDEARELLLSLSKQNTKDTTLRTLSDKANLTLAYDRLEAGDIDAATGFFKKGRLSGPVSNTALMGLGRAWAAQEEYKKALVPWLRLSKRDSADPWVQDALLAVPYGFGKLNAYKQALQYYQQALSVFEVELERVGKVEEQVDNGDMLRTLATGFGVDDVLDRDVLPALPKASGASHLWQLFSTHEFQELLRSYVRTGQSLKKITRWTSQVKADDSLPPASREALLNRAATLETRLTTLSGKLQAHMQSLALQELAQRRKRIQAYSAETRFSIAQIYDYAAKRWGEK
ncbi:MAG: tetratricopeptide repeat protein [Gammaproteobacteria bacterium]|nr:tetratricopeptide repeat protein [Gammaproteobacteria bacterium]